LEDLKEKVCQEMDFEGRSHTLKIFGTCEGCQGSAKRSNRES
jgi:Fe2+ or Zn2+ uptake regulation protein